MRKAMLVASVIALACGGAGFALGAATFASAADDVSRTQIVRRVEIGATPVATESHEDEPAPLPPVVREAPEPTTRDDGAREPSRVRVRRLVITSAIESREPADELTTFLAEDHERVYAFVELANTGGDGSLEVTFERAGGPTTGLVELEVPARVGRWRTWAFTRGIRAGEWRAVVRDQEGRELASEHFVVE